MHWVIPRNADRIGIDVPPDFTSGVDLSTLSARRGCGHNGKSGSSDEAGDAREKRSLGSTGRMRIRLVRGHFDKNLIAGNARRETRMDQVLIQAMLSRRDVELPSVPRARDHATVNASLPQRPAGMRTDAIECMEFAVNAKHRLARGDLFLHLSNHVLYDRHLSEEA